MKTGVICLPALLALASVIVLLSPGTMNVATWLRVRQAKCTTRDRSEHSADKRHRRPWHIRAGGLAGGYAGWRRVGETHAFGSDTYRKLINPMRRCGMSHYRRLYVPGGSYFFTVNLAAPGTSTLCDEVGLLRNVYAAVAREHPVVTHVLSDNHHGRLRQPSWPVGLNGRRACPSGGQSHRPDSFSG